jgi:hypothetical protein
MQMAAPRLIVGLQKRCDISQRRSEQDGLALARSMNARRRLSRDGVFEPLRLHDAEAASRCAVPNSAFVARVDRVVDQLGLLNCNCRSLCRRASQKGQSPRERDRRIVSQERVYGERAVAAYRRIFSHNSTQHTGGQ